MISSASDPSHGSRSGQQRFAHRNIYGAANFHLGNYETTLISFQDAAALGDPVSVASLVYQASALHALGRENEARRLVSEMKSNWPDANIASVFREYYEDEVHADDLIDRLIELGWDAN